MTQAELRKLYFDLKDTQQKMEVLGKQLEKLESNDPTWFFKGKEMVGASYLLATWIKELNKLIECEK